MTRDGYNLTMRRGDSESITVTCASFATGDKVTFTLRDADDKSLIFNKTATEISNNAICIPILPDDTKELEATTYVYDIEWRKANGTVITIMPPISTDKLPRFKIAEDVTYEPAD